MRRRAASLAALAFATAAAGSAHAWDPETHESIARLAFVLSPAAEARLDGQYDAFFEALAEPDAQDRPCRMHPNQPAPRDPAGLAAEVLAQIGRGGPMMQNARFRAQALARYAHFAADAAVPQVLAKDVSTTPQDFWALTTFTVVRAPRPLSAPWAESLRKAGAEARWGVPNRAANAAAFRTAVNLTVDALLALPAPKGAPAAEAGTAVIGVDRVDNGMASADKSYAYGSSYYSSRWVDSGTKLWGDVYAPYYYGAHQSSGQMTLPPTERPGLHLLEWVMRPSETTMEVRALLFNNDDACASDVTLEDGRFSYRIPDGVAPNAVRIVALTAPRAVDLSRMRAVSKRKACAPPFAPSTGTSVKPRVVLNASGRPPRPDDSAGTTLLGQ